MPLLAQGILFYLRILLMAKSSLRCCPSERELYFFFCAEDEAQKKINVTIKPKESNATTASVDDLLKAVNKMSAGSDPWNSSMNTTVVPKSQTAQNLSLSFFDPMVAAADA